MSIKLRYVPEVKGINLFGNELKLPQFVDDTNLFCTDLISVDKKKIQDKIKLTVFYRDLEKVGLRMADVDVMFKALGLARIP